MILENYITSNRPQFIARVESISRNLGINPNWLMAVMFKESNLNHRATNNATGATGLIQFMPFTAIGLGTTTGQLLQMSNVEQLGYVEKYFEQYKGKLNSYLDTYLAVFYPAAIGESSNYTFPENVYKYNQGLDLDRDAKLQLADIESWLFNGFDSATQSELKKKVT